MIPPSCLPVLVCKYPCWCRCHGKHRTASLISRFLSLLVRIELQKNHWQTLLHAKKGSSFPFKSLSFLFLHLLMCTIYVNLELFSFSVYHCLKRHGVDGLGDCGQLAPVLIRHTFAGLPRTLLKDFKTAFLSFITSWLLQVQTESNTLSQEKKYYLLKKIMRDVQY